jgi:hypothetical protein
MTPEVPLNEITLTCNRTTAMVTTRARTSCGALLLADTMRELVSYAVGACSAAMRWRSRG